MDIIKVALPALLMGSICLTSFALGLQAKFADITYLVRRPGLLARSMLAMNVLTPLVAVLLLYWLRLSPPVAVAILVLTVAPVPPMLPAAQLKLGGHAHYVFGLLVTSALSSIVLVPLTLEVLGRVFDRDVGVAPLVIARTVGISVLAPVLAGLLVRRWFPVFAERRAYVIALVANIALVLCFLPFIIASTPAAVSLIGNGSVLAIAAVVGAALGIGHLLGGPDPVDRTTLALACASRHPGVALAIVKANFVHLHAGGALVLFFIVGALATLPYKTWRRRRAPSPSVAVQP